MEINGLLVLVSSVCEHPNRRPQDVKRQKTRNALGAFFFSYVPAFCPRPSFLAFCFFCFFFFNGSGGGGGDGDGDGEEKVNFRSFVYIELRYAALGGRGKKAKEMGETSQGALARGAGAGGRGGKRRARGEERAARGQRGSK